MKTAELEITNRLGLHARASARFVACASEFASEIMVSRNGKTVNGKSIMGIMMLAAAKGTHIAINVNGDDENEALERLQALVVGGFGEDE